MNEKVVKEQAEEKPAAVKNFQKIAEGLGVKAVDAAQLMNIALPNREARRAAAKKLGMDPTPCAFCIKWQRGDDDSGMACIHWRLPLNDCRNNCIAWLNLTADV